MPLAGTVTGSGGGCGAGAVGEGNRVTAAMTATTPRPPAAFARRRSRIPPASPDDGVDRSHRRLDRLEQLADARSQFRVAWSAHRSHQVGGALDGGLRRVAGLFGHATPAVAAVTRVDQDAAQVRIRVVGPAYPPPRHERPGQGGLGDILGGPPVSGQAERQPDQPGPPRHDEGTEVLAAAADDVRVRGELVERIGHHRFHTT
jgi:hypothetical protein